MTKIEPKLAYKTRKEAEKFALQLLRKGMKVSIRKVYNGWSVGVY